MGEIRGTFYDQLNDFMSKVKGERADITARVYFMIKEAEDAGAALQYFLENADEIESSRAEEVEKYFLPVQVGDLREKCEELVKGILGKLVKENMKEDEFYRQLWKKGIEENAFLEKEEEKIYALYCFWMDDRIPYFQLETGMKMTNEEFREITSQRQQEIKKAIFILSTDFSQRTERCSLLNRILESAESEEERAVILAQILNAVERKTFLMFMNAQRDETETGAEQ